VNSLFVTGAGGFIGSRFVQMARDAGYNVYGADKKREPMTDEYDDRITWDCDVADFKQFQSALFKLPTADAIVHLAGTASTPRSMKAPYSVFWDNVATAAVVLQAAQVMRMPVHITSSVKAREGLTPYGAAKVMVETWALSTKTDFDLPVIINRPGTVYGPGQEGSPESGWIAWFLEAARTGQKVTIDGNGLQKRDLLYVDDYCELILTQLADIPMYTDRIWDVGGGHRNAVTVLEMARKLGLDFQHGEPRYGDSMEYIGLNNVPYWSPKTHWTESGMFDV